MLRLLWTAPAMLIALSATPAAAAWLQCAASGSNPSGKVAYETTIADIGAVSPQRMDALKHRLLDHIMKSDPDAKSIAVNCTISDDQLAATTQYDRLLNATVRHLGWEHVRVLAPTEWLADTDIVENPSAE